MGGPGDSAEKTTTSDASPANTNNHPKSAGFGPIRRWRLMKIGRFSATVVVSKSIARRIRPPVEPDMPRLVGRMTIIRQLSDRMTRTMSQSTTRRGGSAEPQRNRASAADRKAGSGCRAEPIAKIP